MNFDRAKIRWASFMNCSFEKGVYFNQSTINELLSFNGSVFSELLILRGVNHGVRKSILCADFSGSIFDGKAFFDNANFKELAIVNANFREYAKFTNSKFLELDLDGTMFSSGADFTSIRLTKGIAQTNAIIIKELKNSNNQFEADEFIVRQLEEHRRSLGFDKFSKKVALSLNWLSTNHGASWVKGVVFTLFVSILSYKLYLLTLSDSVCCDSRRKFFFKFFIVTHDLDFMKDCHPTAASYFVDSVARIFIAYGIVQTVSAFRKHSQY